jgi:hypothetical protein
MNMPQFTANCSLYKHTRTYTATAAHVAVAGHTVSPALGVTYLGIHYCQNLRPGWAIENTLCGDCADFVAKYVCVKGGGCSWQWVQTTDWQPECWDAVQERY